MEYLCPITRELPVDPVMAEDGRIYERSAIEKHIATCQSSASLVSSSSNGDQQGDDVGVNNINASSSRQITSPMSGKKMGPTLYDAVQARNTIHFLISSRTISSELIESWKRNKDVHVVSIDFDGKQVHLADIIEADNSVRCNTTAFYGQFVNKLGCQHLKPNFSDEMIILDDGITSKRLWYSTVVLPGFESRGPVHPSPDDVCQCRVDRSAIEELLGTGALRPVHFQQKRDARNAALSQACELFMDYVRSNYVIANEPQN